MSTLRRFVLTCAFSVLLLPAQAAEAGGWWSYVHVNRSTVAAGERVKVNEEVLFASMAAAREAREARQFYVYLLRGFDYSVVERAMAKGAPGDWWSLGDAEAIRVGRVGLSISQGNLGRARASFTVPGISPATYDLMLCDAGCARPLADVIPTRGFTVVADPAMARMATRIDRLERRVSKQTDLLATIRAAARNASSAARTARSEIEQLGARVSATQRRVGAMEDLPGTMRWAYAGWSVAGGLLAALIVLMLRRSRPREPWPIGEVALQPSDEELRELLAREPSRTSR
jgi:hypothetical protein